MEALPIEDEKEWEAIASSSLAGAYGADEPEYTEIAVKERNPDYELLSKEKK